MASRSEKKRIAKNWAEKQYEKHRRHNALFAQPGEHDCIIILDNLKPSFNIGKIFRSADAFGIREIHLIGTDYFQTKSAKGSFKWVPAYFHENFTDCYSLLAERKYSFYILEPDADDTLHGMKMNEKSVFIFGHEEHGISFQRDEFSNIRSVRVPQYGRVESLNVSVAASIVMYEYIRQHAG